MKRKKRKLRRQAKILLSLIAITIISIGIYTLKKQPEPPNETIQKNQSVKLTVVGDLLFEQPFYDAVNNGYDPYSYFENMHTYFNNDDLTIANMEVVIGNENLKSSGTGYNFCAPEYIGDLVSSCDFDILSTANNHTNDRNLAGIQSTLSYFQNTDITTVGTYASKEERSQIKTKTINDITFSFLSYTYGTNIPLSKENRSLVGLFQDPSTKTITDEYLDIMKKEIKNAKACSDVVIVMVHWGIEFTNEPNDQQRNLAQFFNEQGVDIVVGSHSHSIQPVEWIGDEHRTLVYYSLGNFVSADEDISRTGEKFDNAYQFGLLSTLEVEKNNGIHIKNIKTIPIINFYDKIFTHFKLIPYDQYSEDFEKKHYRYSQNFTKSFISDMYSTVIDKDFQ